MADEQRSRAGFAYHIANLLNEYFGAAYADMDRALVKSTVQRFDFYASTFK